MIRSVAKDRLRCPFVSQVGGGVSRRMGLMGTGLVPRDGVHRVENPAIAPARQPCPYPVDRVELLRLC